MVYSLPNPQYSHGVEAFGETCRLLFVPQHQVQQGPSCMHSDSLIISWRSAEYLILKSSLKLQEPFELNCHNCICKFFEEIVSPFPTLSPKLTARGDTLGKNRKCAPLTQCVTAIGIFDSWNQDTRTEHISCSASYLTHPWDRFRSSLQWTNPFRIEPVAFLLAGRHMYHVEEKGDRKVEGLFLERSCVGHRQSLALAKCQGNYQGTWNLEELWWGLTLHSSLAYLQS